MAVCRFARNLLASLGLLAAFTASAGALDQHLIQMGEPFPETPLPAPRNPEQRAYLGIGPAETFTLGDIRADVVLVEILNVLCPHCRKQSRPYNKLYDRLRADPRTRDRVKMLGVAVANTWKQIADFVEIYAVDFPVVPDTAFELHRSIGGSRTPFTIYVLQTAGPGPGVVAGTHIGVDEDMDNLFAYLAEVTTMEPDAFRELAPEAAPAEVVVEPVLPAEKLRQRVRQSFARLGESVSGFRKIDLPEAFAVFGAEVDGKRFFAEAVSRPSICDVCHDVHFIYLFDAQGRIVAFEALHLTKIGNELWSPDDVDRMRRRVLGKSIATGLSFDPEVDAVTSATMTSAIIFNQLSRGEELLERLRQRGLVN